MWRLLLLIVFASAGWAEPGPMPREVFFDRAGDPLPSGAVLRFGTLRWRSPAKIEQLAFSADEKSILAATLFGVDEYDRTTGRRRALVTFIDGMESVALAPDGQTVYASGTTGLRRWNVPTGKELEPWTKRPCNKLGLAPDGSLLVVQINEDKTNDVFVWNTRVGQQVHTLAYKRGQYSVFAVAPNGERLACGAHQSVDLYDLRNGKAAGGLSFGDGDENDPFTLCFSPDSKHLVATGYLGVYWWEDTAGRHRQYAEDDWLGRCGSVRFCNAGRTLAISSEQGLKFCDFATQKCQTTLPGTTQAKAIGFAKDERTLVTAGSNRVVQLWDVKTAKMLTPTDEPAARVTELAFAPDGRLLYSLCDDGTLRQWDTMTGGELRRVNQKRRQALMVTSDGQRVLAYDHMAALVTWNAMTLRRLSDRPAEENARNAAIAPDGSLLGTGHAEGPIDVHDLVAHTKRTLQDHHSGIDAMLFARQNRVLVTIPFHQRRFANSCGNWTTIASPNAKPRRKRCKRWGPPCCRSCGKPARRAPKRNNAVRPS